ncbi:hypothetical protein D918_03941 [Trichuris suis]|nr:hypothetical protein D918_03941 [Trichuris suis]
MITDATVEEKFGKLNCSPVAYGEKGQLRQITVRQGYTGARLHISGPTAEKEVVQRGSFCPQQKMYNLVCYHYAQRSCRKREGGSSGRLLLTDIVVTLTTHWRPLHERLYAFPPFPLRCYTMAAIVGR